MFVLYVVTKLFVRCVWSHMLTDKYVNQVNKSDLSAQRVVTSVTFIQKKCHSKTCKTKSKSPNLMF